jgi:REP element-mobilizing transposase RayT
MASTLTCNLLHITFSTKHREPMIPESIEPGLYAYVGGVCRRTKSALLAMNGTTDHVHLLMSLAKTIALSDLMLELKRDSSKWIKQQDKAPRSFAWQDGYFGFSIGQSGVEATKKYIAGQKSRHKTVGFQDEVRAFLRKNKMEGDERYMWD